MYTLSTQNKKSEKKTDTIHVRIEEDVKEKATAIFEAMGTDLSGGIKLFLSNVVTEEALGFEPVSAGGLKFKYFQKYGREVARTARIWKEVGDINDPSIDWED